MEDVITDSVAAPDLLDRSEWLPESFKQQQAQTGEPRFIASLVSFNDHASSFQGSSFMSCKRHMSWNCASAAQKAVSGAAADSLCSVHKCEDVVGVSGRHLVLFWHMPSVMRSLFQPTLLPGSTTIGGSLSGAMHFPFQRQLYGLNIVKHCHHYTKLRLTMFWCHQRSKLHCLLHNPKGCWRPFHC